MPILKNVLGLDLGSHSVKAVEVQQTLRGFEAVQLRALPRSDDEQPLPQLLHHFTRMHRMPTEHVVAALPGDRISSRRMSFPFRDKRKLAAAVPFEVESDLLLDLEDVLIDWEVVGGDRNRADVVASVAPRAEVAKLLDALREGGCDPRTLEAEGLVLGNLAAVFDLAGTRLLVDCGHRKTTCCLLRDGQAVASRTIPVGGLALTRALAADRGLGPADAERAKCEDAVLSPSAEPSTPQVGAVLDRLARELARTLGSFEPVLAGGGMVAEVTLFGGTALLDRLDTYLEQRLGLPTARLGLPSDGHSATLAAGGPPIVFAPAIALAVRGTAQARTRTDFRQDEFAVRLDLSRYRRQFGVTAALAAIAAVLAVVSFGTTTVIESHRAGALQQEIDRLYSEAFPGQQGVPPNALGALREAVRSANERAEFLGVYGGNLSALDLLTEISKFVPDELDVAFEELTIDRQTIRMRVNSKSFEAADRLGAELAKYPAFRQARIGGIETDRKTGAKRFNVTINLASEDETG